MADRQLERCVSIDDVRKLARKRLPLPMYDFLAGGSADEVTLRRNVAAFDDIELIPRVARDVAHIEPSVRVFDVELSFPVILAPTGGQGMVHPEAELAPARAASKSNVMYSLSTFATTSIEEIADACPGPKMFQLYALNDRSITDEIVSRARAANYDALCVTVDVPVNAGLERLNRWAINPVSGLPPLRTMAAMAGRPIWTLRHGRMARRRTPDIARRLAARGVEITPDFFETIIRKDLTWKEIAGVVRGWDGPLVIKGILCAEDAIEAANIGATAVVVCNHGGTSLDGTPAAISVLEEIVDAVGDRVEVIQCGGVRRGHSIVKSLAFGASASMIGRPFLFGLAAAGEAGVTHVIEILRREFEVTMKLCGATSIGELNKTTVRGSRTQYRHDQTANDRHLHAPAIGDR